MDRVHGQLAELNARSVLPVNPKPNSLMLTSGSDDGKTPNQASENIAGSSSFQQSNDGSKYKDQSEAPKLQQQQASIELKRQVSFQRQNVATSSPPISSETLASNLRKMIVSSSASIGRKLGNMSVTSTVQSITPIVRPNQRKEPQAHAQERPNFEMRKAEYKHPVIMPESPTGLRPQTATATMRIKPADETRYPSETANRESRSDYEDFETSEFPPDSRLSRDSQKNQLSRLTQPGELATLSGLVNISAKLVQMNSLILTLDFHQPKSL